MEQQYSPITAGTQLRTFDATTIRLTETVHPPMLQLAPHRHERPSIALVINGSFLERFGDNVHQCTTGSIVIKSAEAIHSDSYGKNGARTLIIELFPDFLPLIPSVTPVFRKTPVVTETMAFVARRIYNEFSFMDECSILSIEALILELLAKTIRENSSESDPSRIPVWLKRAKELMKEEFRTSPDLKRIAATAGVHPAHLARAFHKKYGCTVGEYLRRLRLEQAIMDLEQTDKSISQISHDAGFYDQSHFVRCFKKHTGMTPAQYRRG